MCIQGLAQDYWHQEQDEARKESWGHIAEGNEFCCVVMRATDIFEKHPAIIL